MDYRFLFRIGVVLITLVNCYESGFVERNPIVFEPAGTPSKQIAKSVQFHDHEITLLSPCPALRSFPKHISVPIQVKCVANYEANFRKPLLENICAQPAKASFPTNEITTIRPIADQKVSTGKKQSKREIITYAVVGVRAVQAGALATTYSLMARDAILNRTKE